MSFFSTPKSNSAMMVRLARSHMRNLRFDQAAPGHLFHQTKIFQYLEGGSVRGRRPRAVVDTGLRFEQPNVQALPGERECGHHADRAAACNDDRTFRLHIRSRVHAVSSCRSCIGRDHDVDQTSKRVTRRMADLRPRPRHQAPMTPSPCLLSVGQEPEDSLAIIKPLARWVPLWSRGGRPGGRRSKQWT